MRENTPATALVLITMTDLEGGGCITPTEVVEARSDNSGSKGEFFVTPNMCEKRAAAGGVNASLDLKRSSYS